MNSPRPGHYYVAKTPHDSFGRLAVPGNAVASGYDADIFEYFRHRDSLKLRENAVKKREYDVAQREQSFKARQDAVTAREELIAKGRSILDALRSRMDALEAREQELAAAQDPDDDVLATPPGMEGETETLS